MATMKAQYQLEHIHDDRAPELLGSQIICFILTFIAVVLRLSSRKLGLHYWLRDCWYAGYVSRFAISAHFENEHPSYHPWSAVAAGAGRHAILLKDPVHYLKLVFASSILYLLAIATVKISILLFYRRIFKVSRAFIIVSWCLGLFISSYTLAGILVVILQCRPVHAFWNFEVPRTCIKFSAPTVVLAVLNVVTDFLTLALPMPLIWKLHVSTERKIFLAGIFLLGSFVCIGSIYRAKSIISLDASWSDVDPAIWATVEMSLGIVSACLPCLRPLLNRTTQQQKNRQGCCKGSERDDKKRLKGSDGLEMQRLDGRS